MKKIKIRSAYEFKSSSQAVVFRFHLFIRRILKTGSKTQKIFWRIKSSRRLKRERIMANC